MPQQSLPVFLDTRAVAEAARADMPSHGGVAVAGGPDEPDRLILPVPDQVRQLVEAFKRFTKGYFEENPDKPQDFKKVLSAWIEERETNIQRVTIDPLNPDIRQPTREMLELYKQTFREVVADRKPKHR